MGAYISQNGKDFESIFPASFNFWNNVYISKEYNIQELKNGEFMLISYGNFISSYYGRKYWKIVNTGIRPTRVWSGTPQHFISDNNGKIYIFIDSVGLYTSTDFGITWQRTDSLTFNDILVFSSVVDSANRLLVGTSTGLFISSDEGRYWFNLPFLTSKSITKMLQISNDTIIAVVGKNELYISEDKGNSWELFKNRLNTIDSITGIGINSKKEIFVSTYGSGIYKYSNNKWIQSNRGLNYLYVDRMLITQKDEILINIEETLNYSNKGGDYWVDISDDLYKILLQTKDGKIYFKYYYFICYVDSIPENTMATPGWIDKGDYLEQKVKIYNTKFLKYSKDGKNVYTFCGYPYHIYKWDVETGEMIEDKIFLYYNIMDLYDEDKFKVLMSNGNSNYADTTFLINFYENDLDSIVNQINISLGKIYSVENVYAFLLPNNKLITSFNSDSFNQISLWDLNSGENIKYIDLPYKFIIKKIETDLLVIKSVTRGYNNQNIDTFHILITDFNLSEIKEIYSEPFKRGSYEPDVTDFDAVKNTNKNSLLLSVNNNELIEIDLNSYEQIGTIKTKEICSKSQPISIILSDDSKYLISNVKDLNEDYYIKFFNLGTRKVDYSYHFSESTVNMALSPNSNDIAEGGSNGLLRILKPRVFNSEFNANFTSDSTFVIENEPLQFYDISNGNPIWWVWDFGDGTGSDEKNPIHTYRKSGEFNVKLIAYDGNKIDSVIKENYVTVKSQLIANYIASPRIGYIPLYVQFIDKSVGEDYKKRWLLFDGGIYETYDPKILFDEPGVFEVSLTVYNNYFSDTHIDSVIVLDTVSSIIDLNNEFSASTLPNPATDFVIVSFSVKQLSFVSVSLTDIIGNTVNYLENEFIESSCHIKKLDVSNLENGIYFLRISGNGINKVSKIIVCR
ncbi:MAG: PKD domain-containing protein [Ignavibacteriae bacterium]|nr:PKD domain-containing protein [Ignavibacteriota bacterium]